MIVYYEYFNANDWTFVLRSIQFHFSIFFSSRIYLFSILLKELYVNFRFLIMCKMGMSRISTIMENFNYMHILMVSVGSFVINWIISNGLQCEMREILYSKIPIHIELYTALWYKIITTLRYTYIVFLFGMEMLFTQQTKKNNNVKEWYIIEKLIFQVTDFQTFSVMLFYWCQEFNPTLTVLFILNSISLDHLLA